MTPVRVMSYSILSGGRRGPALRAAVRAAAPDVLLLNESPTTPVVWKRRARRLADAWRLRLVTGGRPSGGNMILVGDAVVVKSAGAATLTRRPFAPRRGIAWAQLRTRDGVLFGVVSCALGPDGDARTAEVEHVVRTAGRLRGVVIVAGDLNEPPDGPAWRRLRDAGFTDRGSEQWLTFPAGMPEARVDAVLVRGGAAVGEHGDPGVPAALLARASDHRPVLAVVDL